MNDLQITISPESQIPAVSGNKQKAQPSIYGKIPDVPTQEIGGGVKFDFCDGIRVLIPNNGKEYRCCFRDLDSNLVLYNMDAAPGAMVTSRKKFFVRFRLEIYGKGENNVLYSHDFDASGREVMIQLPVGTLGDSIAWFSYVERFRKKHKCKIVCVMTSWIAEIFKNQYSDIEFIAPEDCVSRKPYACYYLGLFFRGNEDNQPVDFRYIGLHRTAGMILGLSDLSDDPPRVDLSAPRKIKEKYVCIAVQASSHAKKWNNPWGWGAVVLHLRSLGYRVLCIDRELTHGGGIVWTSIPNGAEDFTGNLPLQERIDLLKGADFFVGLSSGLSWLAWCCRIPVVLISGFTEPQNEFFTPYRVISRHACHGCWNDMRVDFDHYDYLWCPRHKGTERQFECTRMITPEQVIETINQIPCVAAKGEKQ